MKRDTRENTMQTCPAPTPTTLPYTNGFGYWYLTVKAIRMADWRDAWTF